MILNNYATNLHTKIARRNMTINRKKLDHFFEKSWRDGVWPSQDLYPTVMLMYMQNLNSLDPIATSH